MNEFKTKLDSILKADTTLRSLLSKAVAPYGIYFVRPPAKPTFPLLIYKIIGGSVNAASRDVQTREFVLVISAYSKTNCNQILERVKAVVNQSTAFTDMTTCRVLFIGLENSGGDDFDPEFQTYVRDHRYRVWLLKLITGG